MPASHKDHVSDYLTISMEYQASETPPVGVEGDARVSMVTAPDGRQLLFHYHDPQTSPQLESVTLRAGGTDYPNLVRYEYVNGCGLKQPGRSECGDGKLKRVLWHDDETWGIEYDYGKFSVTGHETYVLEDPPSSPAQYQAKLCMISKVNVGSLSNKLPLIGIEYDYGASGDPEVSLCTAQWFHDPESSKWRNGHTFEPDTGADVKVTFGSGELYDGSERYDGITVQNDIPKVLYKIDSDTKYLNEIEFQGVISNEAANRKFSRYQRFEDETYKRTRQVQEEQVYIDGAWETIVDYDYGDAQDFSRSDRVTKITRFTQSGLAGPIETTISYDDTGPFKKRPSEIVHPGGRKDEFLYDDAGRIELYERYQLDDTSNPVKLFEVAVWDVLPPASSPPDLDTGLLSQIVIRPEGTEAPDRTIDYTYYETSNFAIGEIGGFLKSVSADGSQIEYKYDDFGNVTSIVKDGDTVNGRATYIYSPASGPDAFLPPRLLEVNDVAGNKTSYEYDNQQRIFQVTDPDNGQTTYTYDLMNNLKTVTEPGVGTMTYTYDIYQNLVKMVDPLGAETEYVYDALDRLKTEAVHKDATDDWYRVEYAYSGGGGGCGPCGGGRPDLLKSRKIIDGEDPLTYDIASLAYDLAGRLTQQKVEKFVDGTEFTADEIIYDYTYDETRLSQIDHTPALWGNGSLAYEYDSLYRPSREVYPNGRYNEFIYDGDNRLEAVKDPFGFINAIDHDDLNYGRVEALTHSTLGQASFAYDAEHRLDRITHVTGAYTQFGYDAKDRLISFDIRQDDNTQLLKHTWQYDPLWRKDAAAGISYDSAFVSPAPAQPKGKIEISYDGGGRMIQEKLTYDDVASTHWDVKYSDPTGYGAGQNRPKLDDGTIYRTFTYYKHDREALVSAGWPLALQYDFKGNVTRRMTLDSVAGTYDYDYEWDVLDRLTKATSGTTVVDYTYDALGRLLYREKGTDERTHIYYLGLGRVAEEERGAETGADMAVFFPDDETQSTPEGNGWHIYTGLGTQSMSYADDADRGNAVHLHSTDPNALGGTFMIGDTNSDINPNDEPWNDTDRRHGALWMRNANTNPTNFVHLRYIVEIEDDQNPPQTSSYDMRFVTTTGTDTIDGNKLWYYIGTSFNDDQWHYMEFDLDQRVKDLLGSGYNLKKVFYFMTRCRDLYLDDLVLSGGMLRRTYQVAGLTTFGSQEGALVQPTPEDALNDDTKTYYHYNDLGTVLSATDHNGDKIGVWEPDHFGNYRLAAAGSPSRPEIGLTGKHFDEDAGLYYFGGRWYDPERGRWLSEEPLGQDGPNPFHFVFNDPINSFDPDGYEACGIGVEGGLGAGAGICGNLHLIVDDHNGWMLNMSVKNGIGYMVAGGASGYYAPGEVKPGMAYEAGGTAAIPGCIGGGTGIGVNALDPTEPTGTSFTAGVGVGFGAVIGAGVTANIPLPIPWPKAVPARGSSPNECMADCKHHTNMVQYRNCYRTCRNIKP